MSGRGTERKLTTVGLVAVKEIKLRSMKVLSDVENDTVFDTKYCRHKLKCDQPKHCSFFVMTLTVTLLRL